MKLSKPIVFLTMAAVALTGLSGCIYNSNINGSNKKFIKPSGKIVSKTYEMGTITSISLNSLPDLVVTQGSTPKIVIKGSDNILPYCQLKKDGNNLSISLSKDYDRNQFQKCDIIVYATVKDLQKVITTGTGDVSFQGPIKADLLTLSTTGTGDISMPAFTAKTLIVNITGTGDVSVNGNADNVKLSISGTGDIKSKLTGINNLSASVSGTGDISIEGNANNAYYKATGTGDILARNMIAKNVQASSSGIGDITCHASDSFSCHKGEENIKCYGETKKNK